MNRGFGRVQRAIMDVLNMGRAVWMTHRQAEAQADRIPEIPGTRSAVRRWRKPDCVRLTAHGAAPCSNLPSHFEKIRRT